MTALAEEFRLDMQDSFPGFFRVLNFYFLQDLKINFMKGEIAGHAVSLFDLYHFSAKEFLKYYQQETVIEIDGRVMRGGNANFSLARSSLTSIGELYKILKALKQSQGAYAPQE